MLDLTNAAHVAQLVDRVSFPVSDPGEQTVIATGLRLVPDTDGGAVPNPERVKYLMYPSSAWNGGFATLDFYTSATGNHTLWMRGDGTYGGALIRLLSDRVTVGSYPNGANPSLVIESDAAASTFRWKSYTAGVLHRAIAYVRPATNSCVVKGLFYRVDNGAFVAINRAVCDANADLANPYNIGFGCNNNSGNGVTFNAFDARQMTFSLEIADARDLVQCTYRGFHGPLLECAFWRDTGVTDDFTIELVDVNGNPAPSGWTLQTFNKTRDEDTGEYGSQSVFTTSDTGCFCRVTADETVAVNEAGLILALKVSDGVTSMLEHFVISVYDSEDLPADELEVEIIGSSTTAADTSGFADEAIANYPDSMDAGSPLWNLVVTTEGVGGTSVASHWYAGGALANYAISQAIRKKAAMVQGLCPANGFASGTEWADYKSLVRGFCLEFTRRLRRFVLSEMGADYAAVTASVTGTVVAINDGVNGPRTEIELSAAFAAVDNSYANQPFRFGPTGVAPYLYRDRSAYSAARALRTDVDVTTYVTVGMAVSVMNADSNAVKRSVNAGILTLATLGHADCIEVSDIGPYRKMHFHPNGFNSGKASDPGGSRNSMKADQLHQTSPQTTAYNYWLDTNFWAFQRGLNIVLSGTEESGLPGFESVFSAAFSAALASTLDGTPAINPNATTVPGLMQSGAFSCDDGTIDPVTGAYTAPMTPGTDTIRWTAAYGLFEVTKEVTILAPPSGGGKGMRKLRGLSLKRTIGNGRW